MQFVKLFLNFSPMKLLFKFIIWIFLILICQMNITYLSPVHKKPQFCDQDRESFSFLWMIKREPPSYLFGTIHVPYTRVWDHIPQNAKMAFRSCSSVFFELDLMDPDTVSALSTCQMLPHGMNLSEVLPEDLYDRLKRHLEYVKGMMPRWMTEDQKGRGMYADYLFKAIAGNWERKRPVWVMLMVNSLTENDVRSRGEPVLDLYLAQEAERMRKITGAIEKVEEQCLPLNGLNFSQVLFALNHTLHQQEELRESDLHTSYTTDDLIHHYNCGDLDAVIFSQDTTQVPTLSNSTLTDEDAAVAGNIDLYFRQELIHNRNMRIGNRVARLLRANPGQSLFFAFGAGHFLGNNTVLDFVQEHGYEIEHLTVDSKIPEPKDTLKFMPFAKATHRTTSSATSEKKKTKDNAVTWWKSSSQGRRLNRRKMTSPPPSGAPLGAYPHTTASNVQLSTPRPRHFNDLWVRLDDYHRQTSHLSDGTSKLDNDLVQNILRRRHYSSQQTSNASILSRSIKTTMLSLYIYYTTLTFLTLTFHIAGDHTGIT